MFKEFLSYRSHQVALLALFAVSLISTQVPLFNYLGYEFSALIALVWSLIAGLLTISLWNKETTRDSRSISPFVVRSLALCLSPLLVPFVVISLNALFVKNCSFVQGAVLFLLIAVPAVLFTHALSLLIAVASIRKKKTVFVISWLLVLLQIVYVTFSGPQIFAFNPILGYFCGLTYDETLEVVNRLLIYRIGTISFSALLLLGAAALHRRRFVDTAGKTSRSSLPAKVLIAALLVVVAAIFFFSNRLGLSSSGSYIQATLGGRAETEHFIVSYPDTILKGPRLEQVLQLHEFYYNELVRILRIRPAAKIHSFIYASQDQKSRLIGASGTDIAKPWLWQLHINLSDVDATLRHELVHVLAAEFGFPLLRVGVNSGLIEGLAMAVDRIEFDEPIHRLAAMVYASGINPDVESLFTLTGFMKAPAGVSYTLAGSFCRFLIDRYGMRRFKLLYRSGEFSLIYERSLPQLLQDWRRSLNGFHFTDSDLAKADYLFKRRSIFGKECARVIANLNKETRDLLAEKKFGEALASANRSLFHTMSVEAVYQKTTALVRLGRYSEAASTAENELNDSIAAPSFLTLKLLLGDAFWGMNSLDSAMRVDSELLRTHLSLAWDESLALRLEILLRPDLATELKPYFLTPMDDSLRIALLERIALERPKDPVPNYLLARERISSDRLDDAVRLLDGIPPFSSPILELSRLHRLAQLSAALGRYEKAKIYYWQSLNHLYRDTQGQEIEERLRFCDWMEAAQHRPN